MAEPLVSVIVRSMDRPSLGEALASVAAQTHAAVELVLVNATGRTHSAVELGARVSLRLVDHGVALRRSAAANAGLDAASGQLLIFLDDDDRLLPRHLETLVGALSSEEARATPLAYAGVRCVDAAWNATGREYRVPFDRVRLFAGNFIPIHAAMFRRAALDANCRFDEALDVYEDWDFWLQLMSLGDFAFVDVVTAEYRILGPSSGFGVNFDEQASTVAREVMRKWLPAWRSEDVLAALERVVMREQELRDLDSAMGQLVDADRQLRDASHRLLEADERFNEMSRVLERVQHDLAEAEARRARSEAFVVECSGKCRGLENELAARVRQIESMEASTSWRVTAPLRGIAKLICGEGKS